MSIFRGLYAYEWEFHEGNGCRKTSEELWKTTQWGTCNNMNFDKGKLVAITGSVLSACSRELGNTCAEEAEVTA